ncbi:MAG TPA: hypothetical protein EYG03_00510 [Planctomycetes bacterium]|nr:hypothetical protein [Fuerstiella sp.]HIK90461.1 hypothetical protein [Planctomycetota bacterium]
MKSVVEKALKPVLVIGGLATALAGFYAFFPQFAVAEIAGLDFRQEYTIFVQHWGIMVGLIGVMMVAAAFKPSWVMPVMIYGVLEKAFIVYLVLSNVNENYSRGFWAPAITDGIIVVYSLLYLYYSGNSDGNTAVTETAAESENR